VRERVAEFRQQVTRRLEGALTEERVPAVPADERLYLQLHAYMLRVAIPYGTLTARQLRRLADIADKWDQGYGHFTTRQNLQYNWPKLVDVPDILEALADVEMQPSKPPAIAFARHRRSFRRRSRRRGGRPTPDRGIPRQWSSLHAEFSFLPRKFKIAVTGAEHDRAAIKGARHRPAHPSRREGRAGVRSDRRRRPRRSPFIGKTVREFLPREDLLAYLEAILRVYNRFGRRDNKYKARIKILVHETGIEEIKAQIEAEFAAMEPRAVPAPTRRMNSRASPTSSGRRPMSPCRPCRRRWKRPSERTRPFKAFVDINVHGHKTPGYAIVTVSLKPIGGVPGDATFRADARARGRQRKIRLLANYASATSRTSSCRT